MAAKKAKKTPKKVSLTLDLDTLEKLLDATATLGAPGLCLEKFVDDPELAGELTKRAKKKRKGS
jgi:hypothetical protein